MVLPCTATPPILRGGEMPPLHGTYSHCAPPDPSCLQCPAQGFDRIPGMHVPWGKRCCVSCPASQGAVCPVLHPKVLCVMLHPKPRLDVFQVLSPQQLWDASAHPSHCLSEIQDAPVPLPPNLWVCWACSGFQQTQRSGHKSEPPRYRDLLSASPCVKVSRNGFSCSCQETKIHISKAI